MANHNTAQYSFGDILNNTAIKRTFAPPSVVYSFGDILNNTAIKHHSYYLVFAGCFGDILNNTAIKPRACLFFVGHPQFP